MKYFQFQNHLLQKQATASNKEISFEMNDISRIVCSKSLEMQ